MSHDDIESWLIADNASPTPERPSGVYGGDTQTITAFRGNPSPPAPTAPKPEEPEEAEEEVPPDEDVETQDEVETISDAVNEEELIDESNPFYAAKKKVVEPAKPASKDSSDAAGDILRKMMERRRGSREDQSPGRTNAMSAPISEPEGRSLVSSCSWRRDPG